MLEFVMRLAGIIAWALIVLWWRPGLIGDVLATWMWFYYNRVIEQYVARQKDEADITILTDALGRTVDDLISAQEALVDVAWRLESVMQPATDGIPDCHLATVAQARKDVGDDERIVNIGEQVIMRVKKAQRGKSVDITLEEV